MNLTSEKANTSWLTYIRANDFLSLRSAKDKFVHLVVLKQAKTYVYDASNKVMQSDVQQYCPKNRSDCTACLWGDIFDGNLNLNGKRFRTRLS